jgi:hypothetical protein
MEKEKSFPKKNSDDCQQYSPIAHAKGIGLDNRDIIFGIFRGCFDSVMLVWLY